MSTVQEVPAPTASGLPGIFHIHRLATEHHVQWLARRKRAGVRYTLVMPSYPLMMLTLICDIGWIVQLVGGIASIASYGLGSMPMRLVLLATLGTLVGAVFAGHLTLMREKLIATLRQRILSLGVASLSALVAAIVGILQLALLARVGMPWPLTLVTLTLGGTLGVLGGLPLLLSYRRGVICNIP